VGVKQLKVFLNMIAIMNKWNDLFLQLVLAIDFDLVNSKKIQLKRSNANNEGFVERRLLLGVLF
jgi:hypothetical protein